MKKSNNNLKITQSIKDEKKKKQTSEIESNRSHLKLTETSINDKKKNFDLRSNASGFIHGKSSVISENMNESFDNTRMYQKLDKIIEKSVGASKVLKETIENQDYETKLLSLLKEAESNIDMNQITSPKEEGGKYEYVEKSVLDKLKKDNEDMKKKTNILVEQHAELGKAFKVVEGEYNFLRQLYHSQKKQKEENDNNIDNVTGNIEYFEKLNDVLKNDLTSIKLEKDNIYRTLTSFIGKIDEKYAEEMQSLISSYNNQYFMTKHKAKDEGKVEEYLGKVCSLDKKLCKINYEISCLKKLLVEDKKKNNHH